MSKLDKNIYDGRWQVVERVRKDSKHSSLILENIYNHQKIKIRAETFKKIQSGETTVTNVIKQQLKTHTGKYGI